MEVKQFFVLFLVVVTFLSCENGKDKAYKADIVAERSDKNTEFAMDRGPLDETARLNFTGLTYYPVSMEYVIKGELEPLKRSKTVLLEQGDTMKRMLKYGHAIFELSGKECSLLVYKPMPDPFSETEEYMFIPFFDAGNGAETYEGGRYVYPVFDEKGNLEIDFNRASNPYCSYNHSYNCIVPPVENTLDFEIKAGEKSFH